ncbi:Na+/H+ antiporter subunit E [Amphritea japonica]|uniref:Multicomponent Na+:H+ antiporter subunit E n=1 Tax=Amphritea japonica ATCC BAA-1530 TaxID=1278309 RepID=A0A7R6PAX1_9GAMM|nr:Na+/H+ antiporter subunit E [Amphritea japonica]BBB26123.1 multicomponent Na+:H+ antiporter subunit E [Amphritea japonica ATCC BAA-1530]
MHIAKWAVVLSIFWLLLSGFIEPLLLSFGAISVVIVLFILKRMDKVENEPGQIGTSIRLIRYTPWLIGQIFSSAIHVTKLIWGSPDKVSPAIEKINAKDVPASSRVLYANSITLTPGTLSVDLDESEVTVHALHKSSIEELQKGQMEKKITGIWGENK